MDWDFIRGSILKICLHSQKIVTFGGLLPWYQPFPPHFLYHKPGRYCFGLAPNSVMIWTVAGVDWCLEPVWCRPGMVTIKFQSESPTFNKWLESSLVRFLAHDFLDGPRQRRAFWADSAPFVDTGSIIVLSFADTTKEPGCSQVKRPKFCLILVIFKQITPDYNQVPR